MLLALKVELRPTPEQATWLLKCIGARRCTYDVLLEHFRQDGVKWSKKAACGLFMREVRQPWIAEVASRAPRNAIDGLDAAIAVRCSVHGGRFDEFWGRRAG
ncbi:MAG: helix-turn-helix domain-containing protein [Boseongicola sp. SB0676_bin_33]|uniref:Helix-turn-helix domain-containing protein n=1 Tax=Boseongicola sp. SB0664_bin_43 TaxID=2604844 RepID=A0A6B0Y2H3_9RHOB|nr:helix-turn-helix domain-containing protein [Boseongicola sp. SB0664_bin_43]MYF88787.1 helix-turn-helix domain-containing protein [Boseongicola sp. SB0676_bin_33]MYK30588.1 helix-turn-helix domain-containing protein [Boseongicola sp. SB0670_bin_30]